MTTVALALIVCMVPFVNLNPILYAVASPWHKSREGRAVMAGLVSLALLVDGGLLYSLVPGFPGKTVVAVVVYALILLAQVLMTYALVRLVRGGRSR